MNLRSLSTLQLALVASVAVHAVLLAVRIVDPESFNRVFQDTPLEVILVNTRGNERPEKAQAIAQASLAGGGDAASGRATSPLPPAATTDPGDAAEEARRRVDALQEQQNQMLTQIRQYLATHPLPDPKEVAQKSLVPAEETRRKQLVRLLAEIERRINEENARPRKRYISPATREAIDALYRDTMRRKIEETGTQNFPEANGRKLYGELIMTLTVNFDGRVLATDVEESSGNRALDRRAQAIARNAGPFEPFSEAMRRRGEQIVVVSRFKFTRDETLEATMKGK